MSRQGLMQQLTRREWLAIAAAGAVGASARGTAAQAETEERIATVVREYEAQGFHRTGTPVDQSSAQWLADQVKRAGLSSALETFSLKRVDPIVSRLQIADRHLEGLPLFDGAFTTPAGISGRLGPLNSDAEIGLTQTAVNAAATGALGDARRANRHKAIVAVTKGRRPGLCPSNADSFVEPFGPPVLQVSSDEEPWLVDHAGRGSKVTLITNVLRNGALASNVTAEIAGSGTAVAPIIVMTPRSGWYWCASERGGGIACWLEIMRGLRAARLKRPVHFVASSGHELGHLGINAYIAQRPDVVKRAAAWLHLGANIGAATELTNNLLQSSDDELDQALTSALNSNGLRVDRRALRQATPSGEAEAIHRGGGRYISMIGGNALFHHPDDRGRAAIDPGSIAKFSAAFIALARQLDEL